MGPPVPYWPSVVVKPDTVSGVQTYYVNLILDIIFGGFALTVGIASILVTTTDPVSAIAAAAVIGSATCGLVIVFVINFIVALMSVIRMHHGAREYGPDHQKNAGRGVLFKWIGTTMSTLAAILVVYLVIAGTSVLFSGSAVPTIIYVPLLVTVFWTAGVGPARAAASGRTESGIRAARRRDDDRLPEVRLREPSDECVLHELRRVLEIVTPRTKGILPKRSLRPRETMTAVSQLRMYTIQEGRMGEWLLGWTRGVLPLRRKFGFQVDGAWVVEGENKFVWVLTYDGPDGFEARDAAYYSSPERASLTPDPAPLIEKAETWFMRAALSE